MSVAIAQPVCAESHLFIRYGDECIRFTRLPRSEGVNRVRIKVRPDGQVEVAAPEDADDVEVLEAVRKRSRWIYEKLRKFREQLESVTPRKYVSGETHYYLGKQYLLKIIEAPKAVQNVKLLRGKIEVTLRQKNPEKVRCLLTEWYKTRAREVFSNRLEAMLEQALWVEDKPLIRIQSMQTQWGSCSPNGRLTLNPKLVKAPRACIDYVILHELCHIAEHNHSERFYRLMKQVMPNWGKTKYQLDAMAARILD